MDVVYAKDWVHATVNGNIRRFPPGSHWPADDPYVRANPGQFSGDPRYHLAFTEVRPGYLGDEPAVEQASAAPGERRRTGRS
jgi:hypothetical protein